MKGYIRIFTLVMIILGSIGLVGVMTVFADSAEIPSQSNASLPWEKPTPDKYNFPPAFELSATALVTGGPDNFGYIYADSSEASCSYDFIDIRDTGTPLSLSDDQVSGGIPIGFPFLYYGDIQTDVFVSSNGFLTFDQNFNSGCCSGNFLPSSDGISNMIALFWEDLNPVSNPYPAPGDGIQYQTIGTAPNRTFILQFTNVPHHFNGPLVTGQIQLVEGTDEINLVYQDTPHDLDGAFTSIGIENGDETDGLAYFYGEVGPIADQVCFTPPEPLISVEKTLGLNGMCGTDILTATANSAVTYCYEFTNNSTETYNYHTIVDDHLGILADNFQVTLPPGAITTVVVGPINVATDTINTVGWEACTVDQTPIIIPEPISDTFGSEVHDISDVVITSDVNIMTATISFVGPISPTGSGSFQDLYGYFEIDIDPDSNTGSPPVAGGFCPELHDVLIDYSIPFFAFLTATTGTVPVFDSFGSLAGNAVYNFNSPDLILAFDLNIFNIDPNTVEYSTVLGDDFGPNDCATNSPYPAGGTCDASIDTAAFFVGEPLDISLSNLQSNPTTSLMLVVVLVNLFILSSITLYQRRRPR